MDTDLSLLLNEDSIIAMEADMYSTEENSKIKKLINKALEQLSKFVDWIYKLVVDLINRFQKLFKKTNDTMRGLSTRIIVTDVFGYVDYLERANELLKDEYIYLEQLRILDQKVNSDVSIMDGMKTKIKDNTIRLKADPTRRESYEQIVYYFQKVEETTELLNALLIQTNNVTTPVSQPKKYPKDVLEKRIKEPMNSILANLNETKSKLEITKKMYAERTRMYRRFHSEDINRNEKILNLTATVIKSTIEFETVYTKMIVYIENNVNEE